MPDPTLFSDGTKFTDGTGPLWIDDGFVDVIEAGSGKLMFITPDWSDVSALSVADSDDETPGTPVGNLQTMQPSEIWAVQSGTSAAIIADRGSSQSFNAVSVLFGDATAATTWQVRADDVLGNLTTSPSFDSTVMTYWPTTSDLSKWPSTHSLMIKQTAVTARYVRIDLTGMTRAGRLYIGTMLQLTTNYQKGSSPWGFADTAKISAGSGGQSFVKPGGRPAIQSFNLLSSSPAEMLGQLQQLSLERGREKDVLVVADPVDDAYRFHSMVYGRIEKGHQISSPAFNAYRQQIQVVGLI